MRHAYFWAFHHPNFVLLLKHRDHFGLDVVPRILSFSSMADDLIAH